MGVWVKRILVLNQGFYAVAGFVLGVIVPEIAGFEPYNY